MTRWLKTVQKGFQEKKISGCGLTCCTPQLDNIVCTDSCRQSISWRTRTRMEQQNQDTNPSTKNKAGSSSGSTGLQVSVEDIKDTRTSVEAPCILRLFCFYFKCRKSVSWFHLLSLIQMCLDWTCAAGWMICWKKISGQIVVVGHFLALSLQIWEVQELIFVICV